ncbi:unnamed protein product, partial [Ascophyllum nodosum]
TDAPLSDRQATLDKLTKEREHVLDRWADADTLGLSQVEKEINSFQRKRLKFLFGEKGFNPPVNARNPVSVTMHNPRFSAALWAVNTEAYRRKGTLSRSQKEVVALGVSLSNDCPHCAFIHTAMGGAAGSDVPFDSIQRFYQTRDPGIAFPLSEGTESLNHRLASWSIRHRDVGARDLIPCSSEQVPEVLGTVMLFGILNRVVDTFVSKSEGGPMFPSPVRALMKFESISPMVQRMMSSMMSWVMHDEDAKVQAGQVLREINKVAPIIKGYEGCTDEPPSELPQELTWAAENETIGTSFAFLAAEAEAMSTAFVPDAIRKYMKSWVSTWDGGKAPPGDRAEWLDPLVQASGKTLDLKDKGVVGMLKLMLVVVVASDKTDDNLVSECQ